MRLSSIRIQNYRSLVDTGEIRIERFQAFVGENNSGKSNILRAIDVFLSSGVGGIQENNFFDKTQPIIITCTFKDLSKDERKKLRKYLLGDSLILEKVVSIQLDKNNKSRIVTEYHGYLAAPKDWWLSIDKIVEREGEKPKWQEIAESHNILEFVKQSNGKVTKSSYEAGIRTLLEEKEDIEYDEPIRGETQALGLQPVLVDNLPNVYLLPAITDYSDEIDRRSSSTVFRRLMGDLADRIVQADPDYKEVLSALEKIHALFNPLIDTTSSESVKRLQTIGTLEEILKDKITRLMPGVNSVQIRVEMDNPRDLFSRGVTLKIDDGVLTDVIDKGHGLQRSIIFSLLQTLIDSNRNKLFSSDIEGANIKPIILVIEEPELYIHPQMQRLVFKYLKDFAITDQVIYSSHSPAFVDIEQYHCVGIVRKDCISEGTRVLQSGHGTLGLSNDKKGYQFLKSFGLEQNQLFFAKKIILVEGEQDYIAIVATGRKLGWFEHPEEIGYTVLVSGCKQEIPKFQRLLNAFGLPYTVLLEMDGRDEKDFQNAEILNCLGSNRYVGNPDKLETLVNYPGHFARTYDAFRYFQEDEHITNQLEQLVRDLFQIYA